MKLAQAVSKLSVMFFRSAKSKPLFVIKTF